MYFTITTLADYDKQSQFESALNFDKQSRIVCHKNLQSNGRRFEKSNPPKDLRSNVHTNLNTLSAHEHHSTNLR